MSLTFDQRVVLIERLTRSAARWPRRYTVRVVSWVVLGYLILATLTLLALTLGVGIIGAIVASRAFILLKFAWVPMVLGWLILRSMFVRVEPPVGRVLRPFEAPELFAMIREIRSRVGVGEIEQVLLVPDLNAAVVEVPRFGGLLGWRRYLLIGLPLMLTHSVEELRAVLAHEVGHLSGRHGRIGAWIWRVRASWGRLLESIAARRDPIARGLTRMFDWYVSRLMVVTLVQARMQEFAADQLSVELTNPQTAARALLRSVIGSSLLDERLWKPIWKRVELEPVPSIGPLEELRNRRTEILADPPAEILERELARVTSGEDTHPALRERLERMGVPSPELGPDGTAAGERLAGKLLGGLILELDRDWRAGVLPSWEQRHRELVEAAKRLAEIETTSEPEESVEAERIRLLEELGRSDEAFPLLESAAAVRADDPQVAFAYGRALLGKGDLRGIEHLVTAMQRDWRAVAPACELAYEALREKGLEREAEAWAERYRQQMELLNEAEVEINTLRASDTLTASQLSPELRASVEETVREAGWIGSMWLIRKQLDKIDYGVEIVAVRARWFRFVGAKNLQKLADSAPADVPLMFFQVDDGALIRRLDRVPGARVF